jgi:exodeoxyribonuclease-5
MILSHEQERAADAVMDWRANYPAGRQTFMLGGYAGTGKTTLISHLIKLLPHPAVCTPTGKAAEVLRNKDVEASTIHRLIYEYSDDHRVARKKHLRGVQTIVVDEASMVNLQLLKDLCAFSLPVLFVGDHGQLEPVGADPKIMARCQVKLEEIHRQALDNPIIRLSKAWRERRDVPFWRDPQGRCEICPKRNAYQHVHSGHQLICGYNKSRQRLNNEIRKRAKRGELPEPGERIIILQNNPYYDVFNGQLAIVLKQNGTRKDRYVDLKVATDDGHAFDAPFVIEQFNAEKTLPLRPKKILLADFAYAITAHKSQGSEFNSVVVIEEIHQDWDAARWRYTTTTRAKNKLIYCG